MRTRVFVFPGSVSGYALTKNGFVLTISTVLLVMAINQATFSLGHSYDDDCVVIKIAGRANCNSTENFSNLIDTEIKKGVMKFIFDLSECQIMDSSFLGTIVARMEAAKKEKNCLWVELFDAAPRILELMEDLGALSLFKVMNTDKELAVNYQAVSGESSCDKLTLLRNSVHAHETLLQFITKPDKKAAIESLVQMLRAELESEEANLENKS